MLRSRNRSGMTAWSWTRCCSRWRKLRRGAAEAVTRSIGVSPGASWVRARQPARAKPSGCWRSPTSPSGSSRWGRSGRPTTVVGSSRAHARGPGQRPARAGSAVTPREIYVQFSRNARHGRLTFRALRGKNRYKRGRASRPRRKSRANRTTATLSRTSTRQLHYSTTAVEMAGPTSPGCGASPQQYVPSHVSGP